MLQLGRSHLRVCVDEIDICENGVTGVGGTVAEPVASWDHPNHDFGQFATSLDSKDAIVYGIVSACHHDKDERNWTYGCRDMAV